MSLRRRVWGLESVVCEGIVFGETRDEIGAVWGVCGAWLWVMGVGAPVHRNQRC